MHQYSPTVENDMVTRMGAMSGSGRFGFQDVGHQVHRILGFRI